MSRATVAWQPTPAAMGRLESLAQNYRRDVAGTLRPLIAEHYPALLANPGNEYRKMMELSTKMTVVGQAVTESAGHAYHRRLQTIATLYGGCCFLADSFIDDFGAQATREYLERFETLLTSGWFEARTERERLFYVIIARLFADRDILQPTLRQAILLLYEAQKRDVELRLPGRLDATPRRSRLAQLRLCARDRSGHAIAVLSAFLVPDISLAYLNVIFAAGALIMHIDDHGDCYADLHHRRVTYMNQVRHPVQALRRIFLSHAGRLVQGLPDNDGRALLLAFLTRYYLTRLAKHRQQRQQGASAWAVYE